MHDIVGAINYFKNKLKAGISRGRRKHYEDALESMDKQELNPGGVRLVISLCLGHIHIAGTVDRRLSGGKHD